MSTIQEQKAQLFQQTEQQLREQGFTIASRTRRGPGVAFS
jgi:uncharacterized lipoprotein